MFSLADAELARRELALPGLAALFDPDDLAATARAAGLPIEIPPAHPVYLRYKPGTSCLAGYSATEGGEPTLLYATALSPNSPKLAKALERKSARWLAGGGRFVFEREGIEVCFFPNDDHLRVLLKVLHPSEGSAFIAAVATGTSPTSDERNAGFGARVLAYKPERRCTLAVVRESRPAGVLKAYTPAGFASAERTALALQHMGENRLQRLVSVDRKNRLLLFEWLEGGSLSEAILRDHASQSDLHATGAALAELHSRQAPALPLRSPDRGNILDELIRTLRVLCPESENEAASVASRAESLLLLDESSPVPIHGDFYAKQALLHQNHVSLLDLDEAARGSAAFDIGNFIAYLEFEVARGTLVKESAAAHAESFLDGYSSRRQLPSKSILSANCAASLLALAHHPFRRHLVDWPRLISALIARAGEILNAGNSTSHSAPPRSTASTFQPPSLIRSSAEAADPDSSFPRLDHALSAEYARAALDGRVEVNGKPAHVSNVHATRLIRNKPRRRCVIEYDVTLESGGRRIDETLIGKIRWRGIDHAGYSTVQALREAGFNESASDGIAVPAPRGKIDCFNMWLSSKVSGDLVTRFVLSPNTERVAEQVAEAVYKLNTSDVAPRRIHTIHDELRILEQRLSLVRGRRPEMADRVADIDHACRERFANVVPDEYVHIHRDFYGDQLLVDGERLWLLDLDLFCLGDPALDIGNFLGHVTEFSLRTLGHANGGYAFESALIARSAQLHGESVVERAEAFRTLTLARHLWISTEKSERSAVTEPLLELCESRLSPVSKNRLSGAVL